MEIKNNLPKVLLVAPVSDRHKGVIDKWIKHLDNLSYPNFDVLLTDNTLDKGEYFNYLKDKKLKEGNWGGEKFERNIIVQRYEWTPEKIHPLQMLAYCREEQRKYFLEHTEYSAFFILDDDIFIPRDGIQRLLIYNKDAVGFYAHVFYKPKRVPCVLKSGEIILGQGMNYFSFSEINEYKKFVKKMKKGELTKSEKNLIPFIIKDKQFPNLFKPYATGLGCLLVKRGVMEKVPFRTHPSFIYGEDLWWFNEANDKKVEIWCDSNVRAIHENTEWNSIIKKSKRQMNFFVMTGPVDAKGVDIIDRSLK